MSDTKPKSVLFDRGPLGTGSAFRAPIEIIEAWTPSEVGSALDAMNRAKASGHWLAGVAAYELGYVLTPKLADKLPQKRGEPLLQFGVFDGVSPAETAPSKQPVELSDFVPDWDFETYSDAFDVVHNYLKSGDIYQANLTFPLRATVRGDLGSLYQRLISKQPVPYGAYVNLGETTLLCRSPELFFALSPERQLRTRPMKGTIKRGGTAVEDAALKTELAQSEKDQAENLMITDLLRNDFGRIAKIGSVKVPSLFEVESYATVHQMVSEVTAELLPDSSLTDILTAVFPCGSITGAPKIRAMEILSELEPNARDAYCGAIGWIAPNGAMEFNVAIRTLKCSPDGQVTLNVGGGVVYDSTAESEYREALLKAQFARV